MALRYIVQDGDPILKKVCRPVTKFDDRLATLLDDMKETLADANGYGLAGPQVGVMRRVFISIDERDIPEGVVPPLTDWVAMFRLHGLCLGEMLVTLWHNQTDTDMKYL